MSLTKQKLKTKPQAPGPGSLYIEFSRENEDDITRERKEYIEEV